jgi:hypothetical protein
VGVRVIEQFGGTMGRIYATDELNNTGHRYITHIHITKNKTEDYRRDYV